MTNSGNGRIDPAVVEALYADHGRELRAFLVGVLRDAELAGEALQSAFAKALESGHTVREESLKGWLFRVAYHEAMLLRRRQGTRDRALRVLAGTTGIAAESPEEAAGRRELAVRIRTALDRLPAEQRQVVRMRIYEDKTFAAIAAELGLPLGTVLTRMRLALKKLAERLPTDSAGHES